MDLLIGGKEYTLEFGLKFINELDKAYTQRLNGVEFGMGVESAITYLAMENPTVLYQIIKAGTSHLKSEPSNDDIEKFLVEHAEKGTLEKLFKDIQEAMEKAPFLKQKIQNFKKQAAVASE
ncbi:tail assembly chaperone [Bacillus sp. IITD106]|nr:tail assembly chaperone [Bacillus sp. IITD106]